MMNVIRRFEVLILMAIALAVPLEASDDVTWDVRLEIGQAQTVPGIPVAMTVSMVNKSPVPQPTPRVCELEVRSKNGEPSFHPLTFDPDRSSNPVTSWQSLDPMAEVSPGNSRTVSFPVYGDLLGPSWFCDPRLNEPGKYELRLVVAVDEVRPGIDPVRVVRSAWVPLEVLKPSSDADRAVYTEMLRLGGGKWSALDWSDHGGQLAVYLWKDHRSSSYTPYVMGYLAPGSEDAKLAMLREALSLAKDDFARMFVGGGLLTILNHECDMAIRRDKDEARAGELLKEATLVGRRLAAIKTPTPWTKDLEVRIAETNRLGDNHPQLVRDVN